MKKKQKQEPKFTIFANAKGKKPIGEYTLEEFIQAIKKGTWKKQIETLRKREDEKSFRAYKNTLPAVTISGNFTARDKYTDVGKRLNGHTGYIAIDIDKKDNPKMRAADLVDTECVAQFISCSGEGKKVIYRCTPVETNAQHRRIYDAVIERLEKKGIKLKVDPIVKSIASIQYVSHDPTAHYNPKTKLVIHPLPPVKKVKTKESVEGKEMEEQLQVYVDALGDRDVTATYENWLLIAFGLSHSMGEQGRKFFHLLCRNYPDYNPEECDEKYDGCMEQRDKNVESPVTISTVYHIINDALPKVKQRQMAKKFNQSHAVGVGEDTEQQGDLAGHVRYGLFLYKKSIDKKTQVVTDLKPAKLNLNAFEALLNEKGFYRYGHGGTRLYVHIVDNIVEEVDTYDILRMITEHIETSGNAKFNYQQVEYDISWEELAHLWRELRANSSIVQQIASSLPHWAPKLLKDTPGESFIPYLNGVVKVTSKETLLIPYSEISQQIWKERILPRNYKYVDKPGMFEEFFINVTSKLGTKERQVSPSFLRSKWYYGYMLHGMKRQSSARAWLLYDTRSGNNGRSGKTIIGTSLGHIRNVTVIDGKQVDLRNRFAWQTVKPYTNILFIDDPAKHISLNPFFNMITGKAQADRKGAEPLEVDLKVLFASNFILEASGESEKGRQFVTQVNEFYVQWGKENGDTLTPIVDLHGKEFFTDWSAHDWNQFDSFAVRALQYYFTNDSAPVAEIQGNSGQLRFIQLHEMELFYELATAFKDHAKNADVGGGCVIVQQVLTNILREGNEHLKANKAGKVAREFLEAIGAKNIELSTIRVGGLPKTAYRMSNKMEEMRLDIIKEEGKLTGKKGKK